MKFFFVLFLEIVSARPATTSVIPTVTGPLKTRQVSTTTLEGDYELPTTTSWSTTSTLTYGIKTTDKNYYPTTTTGISTSSSPTAVESTTDESAESTKQMVPFGENTTVESTTTEQTTDKNYNPTTTTEMSTSSSPTTMESTTQTVSSGENTTNEYTTTTVEPTIIVNNKFHQSGELTTTTWFGRFLSGAEDAFDKGREMVSNGTCFLTTWIVEENSNYFCSAK